MNLDKAMFAEENKNFTAIMALIGMFFIGNLFIGMALYLFGVI